MPAILGLGFAAAVYPQLLAVVVVILTRPSPRRLLWACYLGSICMSVGCAVIALLVFRDRAGIAGSNSHHVGGSVFVVVGVIAVALALLLSNERGRGVLASGASLLPQRGSEKSGKSRAHRALEGGSARVALVVGVVLGIPGPFDLVAVGRLARGGYALATALIMILALNLIKFLLIEIPIVSYALEPEETAARVERFSTWLKANKMALLALVVGVIGVVLIFRGVSRLG